MFKLAIISALVVLASCAPADKPAQQGLETSETMWNAAWADPRVAPGAAAAANPWNRWGAAAAGADPRWNRWGAAAGADPWNRWGTGAGAWNQPWNRAGVPATAAAAAAGNRAWYPW